MYEWILAQTMTSDALAAKHRHSHASDVKRFFRAFFTYHRKH